MEVNPYFVFFFFFSFLTKQKTRKKATEFTQPSMNWIIHIHKSHPRGQPTTMPYKSQSKQKPLKPEVEWGVPENSIFPRKYIHPISITPWKRILSRGHLRENINNIQQEQRNPH